jgi:hypothetical protein
MTFGVSVLLLSFDKTSWVLVLHDAVKIKAPDRHDRI